MVSKIVQREAVERVANVNQKSTMAIGRSVRVITVLTIAPRFLGKITNPAVDITSTDYNSFCIIREEWVCHSSKHFILEINRVCWWNIVASYSVISK